MRKVGRVYLLRLLLILITGFSLHIPCFAQPWPNDPDGGGPSADQNDFETDDPGDPDPGHDPDVPIDTNILMIVGAVVIYGLKKAWDVNRRKRERVQTVANYEDFIK